MSIRLQPHDAPGATVPHNYPETKRAVCIGEELVCWADGTGRTIGMSMGLCEKVKDSKGDKDLLTYIPRRPDQEMSEQG
jgi:hypothetical protein